MISASSMLVTPDGEPIDLDVGFDVVRYFDPPSIGERRMLRRLDGPVLDIGCGPGRIVEFLHHRGVPALGIDVGRKLVERARRRGLHCAEACVFGAVPFEGRWRVGLLLDGNIGIGGDPVALLERVGRLLAPGGCVYVEAGRSGGRNQTVRVRARVGDREGPEFPWALVSLDGLDSVAAHAGFATGRLHQFDGRFVRRLDRCA